MRRFACERFDAEIKEPAPSKRGMMIEEVLPAETDLLVMREICRIVVWRMLDEIVGWLEN